MPIPGVTSSSDNRQPGTPTIGAATAGNASVSVAFTAPANTGKPNTSLTYTAITTPGSITGTGSASPVTISGLSNGTSYTAVVKLNNTVQDSLNSAASNSFTPIAPPFFPFFPPFFPFFPPSFPFFPPYFPTFTPTPTITGPTVTDITTTGGTVSWSSTNQASYMISTSPTSNLDGSGGALATSRLFTGGTAGTTYNVTVTVYSGLSQTGNSASGSTSFTTLGASPSFPFFPPYFPFFPPSFPFFPPYFPTFTPQASRLCTADDVTNQFADCSFIGECRPGAQGELC
jgi:hypothetical protein